MHRRTLLTAVGFGCLTGCIESQTPSDSTGSQNGPDDEEQSKSDDNTIAEPQAEFSVGDRSGVTFPDASKPVSYRLLNHGEARSVQIVALLEGAVKIDETVNLSDDACAMITFQQPADYDLQVGVGDDPASVAQISADEFSCSRMRGTITIDPQGCIESQVETTNPDCPGPTVTDSSLQTDSGECGTDHTATVSFADGTVRVSGRVRAPQPCYQLVLESASYDTAEETLTVTIAVDDRTEAICVDCLGEIPYQADIELQHDYPQNVLIQHRESNGQLVDVNQTSK